MWQLAPGMEPFPGYKLVRHLGQGAIGDVWQADGPGGTAAALKFIRLAGADGLKEFRAIQRIKRLVHPNLNPVTACWRVDSGGQILSDDDDQPAVALVVAMLLGSMSLQSKLSKCQKRGLSGIPADELVGYIEDAAKGIDFLNQADHDLGELDPGPIQHCDIKPLNLLLVGGSVQVCDFGLASALEGHQRSIQTLGGTPAYMAPEICKGELPTHTTDQYSLAISYYELRTGRFPMDSSDLKSISSVADAHTNHRLHFEDVPDAEATILHRATALNPVDRYGTTREFARHLRNVIENRKRAPTHDNVGISDDTVPLRPPPGMVRTDPATGDRTVFNDTVQAKGLGDTGKQTAPAEHVEASIDAAATDSGAQGSSRSRSRGVWVAAAAVGLALVVAVIVVAARNREPTPVAAGPGSRDLSGPEQPPEQDPGQQPEQQPGQNPPPGQNPEGNPQPPTPGAAASSANWETALRHWREGDRAAAVAARPTVEDWDAALAACVKTRRKVQEDPFYAIAVAEQTAPRLWVSAGLDGAFRSSDFPEDFLAAGPTRALIAISDDGEWVAAGDQNRSGRLRIWSARAQQTYATQFGDGGLLFRSLAATDDAVAAVSSKGEIAFVRHLADNRPQKLAGLQLADSARMTGVVAAMARDIGAEPAGDSAGFLSLDETGGLSFWRTSPDAWQPSTVGKISAEGSWTLLGKSGDAFFVADEYGKALVWPEPSPGELRFAGKPLLLEDRGTVKSIAAMQSGGQQWLFTINTARSEWLGFWSSESPGDRFGIDADAFHTPLGAVNVLAALDANTLLLGLDSGELIELDVERLLLTFMARP